MWRHVNERLSIFRHKGEYATLHDLVRLYVYVVIFWGFYRVLFRLPVEIEELILKPLVFVVPVLMRIRTDGQHWGERLASVGITWKNLFAGLAFGLSLGVFYLFVGRLGQLFRFGPAAAGAYGADIANPVSVIILAVATAIAEELLFVGYLLPRLMKLWQNEWVAASIVAMAFGLSTYRFWYFLINCRWD